VGVAAWTAPDDLIVVLPAFNEAAALPRLLRRLADVAGPGLRVLVVDDGSTDRTAEEALGLRHALPRLEVVRHARNRGLGAALVSGWQAALAEVPDSGVIGTRDADDTHDPQVMAELVRLLAEGHDVAIASRFAPGGRELGLSLARRLLSFGARVVLSRLRGIPGVRDYTCGYRAYRAGLLRRALAVYGADGLCTTAGFACTAEVLLKLALLGARCAEAPLVLHYEQKAGRSKMRIGRTLLGYAHLLRVTRRARQPA
jgi:dolichol-phosphate mannosyltransferase